MFTGCVQPFASKILLIKIAKWDTLSKGYLFTMKFERYENMIGLDSLVMNSAR